MPHSSLHQRVNGADTTPEAFNSPKAIEILKALTAIAFVSLLLSCSEKPVPLQEETLTEAPTTSTGNLDQAERLYWAALQEHAQNASRSCDTLSTSIQTMLETPDKSNLLNARQRWQRLESQLIKLGSFKHLSDVTPERFPNSRTLLFNILANPIQPGYLDSFGPYPFSGIVFDVGFVLNKDALKHQNALTDNEEILLGLYAIQFMLFGEQNTRSVSDYEPVTELSTKQIEQQYAGITEVPSNRRRKLLTLQIQLLCDDIGELQAQLNAIDSGDLALWRAQSPQQQLIKTRAAIQQGLTQSQLELAQLQTALTTRWEEQKTLDGLPQIDRQDELILRSVDLQSTAIVAKITALQELTVYLGEIEQQATSAALTQASARLKSIDFVNADFGSEEKPPFNAEVQQVYNLLKDAL